MFESHKSTHTQIHNDANTCLKGSAPSDMWTHVSGGNSFPVSTYMCVYIFVYVFTHIKIYAHN